MSSTEDKKVPTESQSVGEAPVTNVPSAVSEFGGSEETGYSAEEGEEELEDDSGIKTEESSVLPEEEEEEEEGELTLFKKRPKKVVKKKIVEVEVIEEEEEDEEEEVEEISLLHRPDSELNPMQRLEKDIMWYDLLMAEEELMEMNPEKREAVIEEIVYVHEEEEEVEQIEVEIVEEEIEEVETVEVEETGIPHEDLDDPDNLVNLLIQQGANDEDEEIHTLFMADFEEAVQEVDTLANIEGIVGITLSDKTKQYFGLENLIESQSKYVWLNWKQVKLHIFTYEAGSEFQPFYNAIKYYPDLTMLLGVDPSKQTGHELFLCLTTDARNRVLNPPKKKKVFFDLKKKEEERWNEMASIAPRKWRGFGSELEVDEEKAKTSRSLITVNVHRFRTFFGGDCNFQDSKADDPNMFASFESQDISLFPSIQALETDRGIQVMAEAISQATQTGLVFKRNKMVQQSTQSISNENAENIMKSKDMAGFFRTTVPRLEKVLQQNEMVDLLHDDYNNLKAKRGHEMEFSTESLLLQEYQTYSDFRHSKGRSVTCMMFHPALEDVVVMALGEDVTFDKRIESHSKVLMEPNFVLFWDLRDSSHPQVMLDAPSDVFSIMINPSDPHLCAGGCANGQIVFWDLGRIYYELRARTQDRKMKNSVNAKGKKPNFLEKLKDSAEKFSCPLIQPSGLSNLDQSHKKVVTSVVWLPPHVELGKNGTLYENSMGGRSVQFFSTAGDGTLRLWDTRLQKSGIEDFEGSENNARDVIKLNPWAHLENNQWKYTLRYTLDDGTGNGTINLQTTVFATIMSLSETRPGDTIIAANMEDHSTESITNKLTSNVSSVDGKKPTKIVQESSTNITDEHDMDDGITGNTKKIGMLQAIANAHTSIFMGTETGQIALVDWFRNKDGSINPDSGGNKVCQNMYLQTYHDGAITSISRSPFYNDLLLVVGGGTITIWKEKSAYPILQCCGSDLFYWCATWSNSRPGVFYVGAREGSVAVWDLMDRSNGPVMTQQISNVRITGISLPKVAASASKKQFLAVSDSEGSLYVLILPRFYARPLPQEDGIMTELMNREEKRMNEWVTNEETRMEKIQAVHDGWKASRVVKSQELQDAEEIEQEDRLNREYIEFLEFQVKTVTKLKREEPSIINAESDISDEFDTLIRAAQERPPEELDDEISSSGPQSPESKVSI